MPIQTRVTPLAGSRSRRQNGSCDQCRKSKRACDAVCLDLTRRTSFNNIDGQRASCSYCARTNKRCTMEWARSQARPTSRFPHLQPHSSGIQDILFPWRANGSQLDPGSGSGSWNDLPEPDFTQELMTWDSESGSGSLLDYNSMLLNSMLSDTESSQEKPQTEIFDAFTFAGSGSDPIPPDFSSSYISTQSPSELELDSMYHQMWPAPQSSQGSQTHSRLGSAPSKSPQRQGDSTWPSFNPQSSHWNSSQRSLSPFSIDQQMINTSNCNLTSANLLQIYHDVLEHSLSCWLSERTCPYQSGSRSTSVPEWVSSRSNMIYQRTIRLDRVAQSCKLLQLSRSEDQAASRALHLAIMAFATQWAQGSRRHCEKYSTRPLDDGGDEIENGIVDEFDRILQHHLWHQAHRAIQEVSEVESYRVACAELIFGLTQRPWDSSDQSPIQGTEDQGHKPTTAAVLANVNDIMNKEGPPIYMERAARKMHALKYRCDARRKGRAKLSGSGDNSDHGIELMRAEDRGTIGLLYWMAIMCDTLSSSMNERPVVVLDQDCEHEAQKETQQAGNSDKFAERTRWNVDLFLQGNLNETRQTHWPCSYEAAAEDIIKSAPVKVLLFRHLSYLQNALRKSAPEDQIEDIIHMTLLLYGYWNKTHGAFFGELVQNYTAVPQRIQGWFLCISAHWHLAVLMLADLLELIDENSLGTEGASHIRVTSQTARRMRMHSARELSGLARVGSTPTMNINNIGVPQMPEYHHTVNEGTLLTEPWTMVLIRAFTKACMVFLGEVDQSSHYVRTTLGHNSHGSERKQAEDCMKGLWLLGKKSDMARDIARTLSLALGELR